MLPENTLRVKHDFAQFAILSKQTTAAEILRNLPKHLAYLKPVVRGLPLPAILQTIENCANAGLDDTGIGNALIVTAEYMATTEKRCVTCLGWTSEPVPMCRVEDGVFAILAFCPKCTKQVAAGKVTAAMLRNLASYGGAS